MESFNAEDVNVTEFVCGNQNSGNKTEVTATYGCSVYVGDNQNSRTKTEVTATYGCSVYVEDNQNSRNKTEVTAICVLLCKNWCILTIYQVSFLSVFLMN